MNRNCIIAAALSLAGLVPLSLRAGEGAGGKGDGRLVTLEQAYDLALSTDQNIGISYVALQAAKLAPLAAFTKLAPQINGYTSANGQSTRSSGNRVVTDASGTGVTGSSSSAAAGRYNDIGFTATQPLFDLTFFPAYRRGKATLEGARLDYRSKIREILFGVAQAYYDVLSQQRLVEVDKETFRLANEQFDLAQKQANVGVVTRSDVLRAQVVVETDRRTMLEDANTLESRRNVLANILNLPVDKPFHVGAPKDYEANLPVFQTVLGKALTQREDLRSKDQAVRRDTESHNEARAAYIPKVSAGLDAGRNSEFQSKYTNNWQANVTVSVPIFNGGQRELDLKTTAFQVQQTRLERDQVAKTVNQDVKDAWLNVKSLTETLAALRTQVAAAEQCYKDIQNQYQAGTTTSLDVLTALNDLKTARKDIALQTFSLQVALRKLEQVCGTFQQDRVNHAPHQ
ncbi:MAG: Outer rane efflux protein [Verrucomicrobiaceae bacterium]|nr:Outer rane efflux protein [Verrucomicrobiaceae bacterium]